MVLSDALMFALHSAGYVLKFDGGVWSILPGLPLQSYVALASDWITTPKILYLATDRSVFASTDNGGTWTNESQDLPANPRCTDLRFVLQPDKTRYLYLSMEDLSGVHYLGCRESPSLSLTSSRL